MTHSVGFIGAGGIASIHLETLDAVVESGTVGEDGAPCDIELAAIADIDGETARAAAGPRGATVYTDGVELIESESLDALVIAVPPFAHGEYERAAADRDLDLFIEKPVALSMGDARETARHLADSEGLSHVGYVCRYARITEYARELLDGRRIGHIDSTYWVPVPESDWWRERRYSGGQIVEQSTHVYDLHRYLAGDVVAATGSGTDGLLVGTIDFQDATSVTLDHDSGAVSHVSSTCASPTPRFEVRIAAEDAVLELDYMDHSLTGTVDGEPVEYDGDGEWYRREFEAFLRASATDHGERRTNDVESVDIRSDFDDAAATLDATLAAREAAETGEKVRTTVETPVDVSNAGTTL
ncbi:Gfo/Idh/MocA family protein [Haladaptatus sp.]|uniref:Gfo/Idh/MocA family protein n=1 Tax=Haladaptatus sp. TaxID=1973141 RepID=UPI003C68A07A